MKRITLTEAQCNALDPKHIVIVTADNEGDTLAMSGVDMIAAARVPGSSCANTTSLHEVIGWYLDTENARGNGTEKIALIDGELCHIVLEF